jgi:integrase
MDEPELVKLLAVARERPLLDATTVRKGKRKGERYANVRPEVRERLELLGRERALIYKCLVLSGLRKGELASLTVAHLQLDEDEPYLTLDPAAEKNRQGNDIPLRPDLAADLRDWLADKLARLQEEARQAGAPIPARLPADTPLFTVPRRLERILDRDLRLAGIPKRDDRGRTLDVHALRTTFGTLLSKGGVPLRTAQAAMRHSDPRLTANVYTDPRLLDVAGALDTLPALPLDGNRTEGQFARMTGTHGELVQADRTPVHDWLAPTLAPNQCKRRQSPSSIVNGRADEPLYQPVETHAITSCPVNKKGQLSFADNRPFESG